MYAYSHREKMCLSYLQYVLQLCSLATDGLILIIKEPSDPIFSFQASKRKLKAKPKDKTTHEQLMDEIKSGSILKSVPEEMRPCPEIKSLETAKGML